MSNQYLQKQNSVYNYNSNFKNFKIKYPWYNVLYLAYTSDNKLSYIITQTKETWNIESTKDLKDIEIQKLFLYIIINLKFLKNIEIRIMFQNCVHTLQLNIDKFVQQQNVIWNMYSLSVYTFCANNNLYKFI